MNIIFYLPSSFVIYLDWLLRSGSRWSRLEHEEHIPILQSVVPRIVRLAVYGICPHKLGIERKLGITFDEF